MIYIYLYALISRIRSRVKARYAVTFSHMIPMALYVALNVRRHQRLLKEDRKLAAPALSRTLPDEPGEPVEYWVASNL